MVENEVSQMFVQCAVEAHRTLGGPGLLESVYEEALPGLKYESIRPLPGGLALSMLGPTRKPEHGC
jgi:hypothetical protein